MKRIIRFLVPTVALLLSAGCATGGVQDREEATDAIRVVVVNDLSPPVAVTVRVIGATTAYRSILGNVSPRATRAFTFRPRMPQGQYQLIAETAQGREVASRSFQANTGDEVEWSVRRNTVDLRLQSPNDG